MNFIEINDLPVYDLQKEFEDLYSKGIIKWNSAKDQICINTTKDKLDDYWFGRGSLWYDWDNKYYDENNQLVVPEREVPLKEEDFNCVCSAFQGTLFEDVYRNLEKKYKLGRVRIMNLHSKKCLSWHKDTSIRVHYPMITQEGCYMVIQDEVKHLPKNSWWRTNTLVDHTVFNGSKQDRLHLVATVLEEK